MKVKESGKFDLKFNIQKMKIMASGPYISWQEMGKQWKQWRTLFSWAPRSLQMVTAAMKLKDSCSLEGKLWPTAVQFSCSVTSDSWDSMDYNMPGFPVHQQLPEFIQTHVHGVGDTIQPSHSLLSLSSCLQSFPASGSFQWVSSSHQLAKILEFQFQHQSLQWTPRNDCL